MKQASSTKRAEDPLFCLNTLKRLHALLSCHARDIMTSSSHITAFAGIYRRVIELCEGQSFLDVGTSFGFLPILVAENTPVACISACDNDPNVLNMARHLSISKNTDHITFTLQDVLAENFSCMGRFEIVTALHLLEHLHERDIPLALEHLLHVTSRRLIIAVPYEEILRDDYGHYQKFTPKKLDFYGRQCIEVLQGNGRYWCEDIMGGMLIVEPSH